MSETDEGSIKLKAAEVFKDVESIAESPAGGYKEAEKFQNATSEDLGSTVDGNGNTFARCGSAYSHLLMPEKLEKAWEHSKETSPFTFFVKKS